ncbi:MAG: hypothetical protein HY860_05520 [Chlamydiales bacterium]|nr:hypothetical protein [Chlamydiales bacterium]
MKAMMRNCLDACHNTDGSTDYADALDHHMTDDQNGYTKLLIGKQTTSAHNFLFHLNEKSLGLFQGFI